MESFIDSARIFLLALFTLLISNLSYSNTDNALVWLKAQQQSDGSFHSLATKSSSVQSTLEALSTLNQHEDLQGSVLASANQFLLSKDLKDLESLSGLLRLNTKGMGNFVIPDIKTYEAFSGGFGDYPGYDDSVLGSSYLLLSLSRGALTLPKLIGFVTSKQRSDGSWAEEGNQSSVFVTAIVSRALQKHRLSFNVSRQVDMANQYLLNLRNSSGIWDAQNESALALLAIIPSANNPDVYKQSLSYFMSLQGQNGSWANDVFTTALALQISYLVKNPSEVENASMSNAVGFVKNKNTGEPIVSAKVTVDGAIAYEYLTDSMGYFKALNLMPGNYEITFSATGYKDVSQSLIVNANAQIELGVIRLEQRTDVELIYGQVSDSVTGLPLSGVDVVFVVPGKTVKLVTDQNGFYAQELNPGGYGFGFDLDGYHPASKTTTLSQGEHYEFSPKLTPLTEPLPPAGFFMGDVWDPTKNLPKTDNWNGSPVWAPIHYVEGAIIREVYSGVSTTSKADGSFKLPMTQGIVQIVIEKSGYKTKVLNGIFVGTDNFTYSVALFPTSELDTGNNSGGGDENSPRKIRGYVLNSATNTTIPNASINIQGNTISADENGMYEYLVEGISESISGVSVSAAGYETTTFDVVLSATATTRKDFPIKKIKLSQIQFEDLLLSKQSYQAYEDVSVTGKLKNTGSEADEVIIQAQILKQDGSILEEFTIHDQNDLETINLNAGETHAFTFNWFTQIYSPGQYSILLNVYSLSDTKLLVQQSFGFEISPTQHITSAKVVASQNTVNQGASDELDLLATIRNRSNIPVSFTLGYELVDPSGISVWQSESSVSINPQDLFPSVAIGELNYVFAKSGSYELRITNVSGVTPDFTENSVVRVVPDINIDLQQAITPDETIPGADQKVRVKIRIEGKEVQ